jgi:hypothetical protein
MSGNERKRAQITKEHYILGWALISDLLGQAERQLAAFKILTATLAGDF